MEFLLVTLEAGDVNAEQVGEGLVLQPLGVALKKQGSDFWGELGLSGHTNL